jgi:hypothetical protein
MPGFLVMFASAMLWFLCSRRLGVIAMLLSMVGSLLMGFISPTYIIMVIWLFIYSLAAPGEYGPRSSRGNLT